MSPSPESDRIWSALQHIGKRFAIQYQEHESVGGGWGQFLDGPRPHRQIGLYGTSAGLLVLSLAGQANTPAAHGAVSLLEDWWGTRESGYGHTKFTQNLRLAFFTMCLRNSDNERSQILAAEVEECLLERLTFSGGWWGDYWVSGAVCDSTPRYLATALSILAVSAIPSAQEKWLNCLALPRRNLEQTLRSQKSLTNAEKALLGAALNANERGIDDKRALFEVESLSLALEAPLSDHSSYFFEYQYRGADEKEIEWGRDSVYIFSQILLGLAGFLDGATVPLRLRAERVLDQVLESIEKENGCFRPVKEGRVSTVEQAWCSFFLAAAHRALERAGEKRLLGRLKYALIRRRTPSRMSEVWFPATAMIVAGLLGAVPLEGAVFNAARAVALLFVYGLYGPKVLRRLFPWRY